MSLTPPKPSWMRVLIVLLVGAILGFLTGLIMGRPVYWTILATVVAGSVIVGQAWRRRRDQDRLRQHLDRSSQ